MSGKAATWEGKLLMSEENNEMLFQNIDQNTWNEERDKRGKGIQ